jgi:hypothetical protein
MNFCKKKALAEMTVQQRRRLDWGFVESGFAGGFFAEVKIKTIFVK